MSAGGDVVAPKKMRCRWPGKLSGGVESVGEENVNLGSRWRIQATQASGGWDSVGETRPDRLDAGNECSRGCRERDRVIVAGRKEGVLCRCTIIRVMRIIIRCGRVKWTGNAET